MDREQGRCSIAREARSRAGEIRVPLAQFHRKRCGVGLRSRAENDVRKRYELIRLGGFKFAVRAYRHRNLDVVEGLVGGEFDPLQPVSLGIPMSEGLHALQEVRA